MSRGIGIVFGLFLLIVAVLNYSNNGVLMREGVLGVGLTGILYLITIAPHPFFKSMQIFLTFLIVCVVIPFNDVNSFVGLVSFHVLARMSLTYYPHIKKIPIMLGLCVLGICLYTGWTFVQVAQITVAYTAYTGILYIFNKKS